MIYLETSAFAKLIWDEESTPALHKFLADRSGVPLISSTLLVIETRRAVLRRDPTVLPRADLLLTRVGRIDMTHAVVEAASRLPEATLRSLDAIHLATALMLGDDLEAFVAYDLRLAEAAGGHGLAVAAPR